MFCYRLHHIQPHYRVQLLTHLHSLATNTHTSSAQLHLWFVLYKYICISEELNPHSILSFLLILLWFQCWNDIITVDYWVQQCWCTNSIVTCYWRNKIPCVDRVRRTKSSFGVDHCKSDSCWSTRTSKSLETPSDPHRSASVSQTSPPNCGSPPACATKSHIYIHTYPIFSISMQSRTR